MSFKIHFRCGNPLLCSGIVAVPSGPKSHTFTLILAGKGLLNVVAPAGWAKSRGDTLVTREYIKESTYS